MRSENRIIQRKRKKQRVTNFYISFFLEIIMFNDQFKFEKVLTQIVDFYVK